MSDLAAASKQLSSSYYPASSTECCGESAVATHSLTKGFSKAVLLASHSCRPWGKSRICIPPGPQSARDLAEGERMGTHRGSAR